MGHVWLAQRTRGAEVQFVKAEGNYLPAANYEKAIDHNTCIVPITHVCFKNGFRSEVSALTQIAHQAGAVLMLDDYQDSGTRPIDVKAMDLDFYLTGTLKYLLGPPGLAFMYVRQELISTLAPTVTGWFAQANPFAYDPQHFELSPTARRFESGSPSVPNVYGAVPGFQILHQHSPSPLNPLGVKGVGEGGAVAPPAAIANAVCDALAPFGVEVNATPINPEQLVRAMRRR